MITNENTEVAAEIAATVTVLSDQAAPAEETRTAFAARLSSVSVADILLLDETPVTPSATEGAVAEVIALIEDEIAVEMPQVAADSGYISYLPESSVEDATHESSDADAETEFVDDVVFIQPVPYEQPGPTEEADSLYGSELSGLGGDDRLFTFSIFGGRAYGGDGNDHVEGWWFNDTLHGDAGNDALVGWAGDDILDGGDGDDVIYGCDGNDTINGGAGADFMEGGGQSDNLNGGDGDDSLNGGEHIDTIDGGAGADRIYLIDVQQTGDTVLNWEDGIDQFMVKGAFSDLIIEQMDGHVRIAVAGGELAMVMNAQASSFTADDFVFL